MVRSLRNWAMSPKGLRCLAAVAQLTGFGILVALLWSWETWAGLAGLAVVVAGWGLLVSWADR